MDNLNLIPLIMPVLVALIILIVAVALIVVYGRTKRAQSAAVSQSAFGELARELKANQTAILSQLGEIQKSVASVERMMKEIQ